MTSLQRREQLIEVGRSLFAAKGFEAVSVEEIAAHAKVSKPIVYEHFGGKEGLYAVIVDREMRALTGTLTAALDDRPCTRARLWNARACAPHLYRRECRGVPGTGTRLAEHRPVRLIQLADGRHRRTR